MNNNVNLQIFLAALQGYIANKDFRGATSPGSPKAAVDFARECVKAAYNYNPNQSEPTLS
jgi:hypothetical protein